MEARHGERSKLTLWRIDSLKCSSFGAFENLAGFTGQKPHAVISLFENVFRGILQDKSSTLFI
jgi:hypothetical protein